MEEEFQKLKKENEELRSKLSKYETETTKSQSEQKLTTPTGKIFFYCLFIEFA